MSFMFNLIWPRVREGCTLQVSVGQVWRDGEGGCGLAKVLRSSRPLKIHGEKPYLSETTRIFSFSPATVANCYCAQEVFDP